MLRRETSQIIQDIVDFSALCPLQVVKNFLDAKNTRQLGFFVCVASHNWMVSLLITNKIRVTQVKKAYQASNFLYGPNSCRIHIGVIKSGNFTVYGKLRNIFIVKPASIERLVFYVINHILMISKSTA